MAKAPKAGIPRPRPWSIYPGAMIGWVMDSFDLSMMFLMIPVLAALFFPSNFGLAVVGTWSIYTTTFIFRPVGGAIFGHVGDRIGRRNAMLITLLGLGLIIFFTGFLPTYAEIGIAAPLLLFVFRIITGIFAGGEYGNSSAVLLESVRSKHRGMWSSAIQSGYPVGYTLAALLFLGLHYVFPGTSFVITGWRWMFWIGIIPVAVGLLIRLLMPESALWRNLAETRKLSRSPLTALFKNKESRSGLFAGILAMTGIAWVYGLSLGFFPTILSTKGFMAFPSFLYVVIVAILMSLVGYFVSGAVSDRIGRRNIMFVYSILGIIFAIPLTYALYTHALGFWGAMLFASALAFLTTGVYGVIPAFLAEKFPTNTRSSGVGLGFNGGFIVGNWSTAILLLLVAITSASFFAFWGIFVILGELCILVAALVSKETKGIDLADVK